MEKFITSSHSTCVRAVRWQGTLTCKIFKTHFYFVYISFLTKYFYVMSKNCCKVLFCDQIFFITNVCRVISRTTGVDLLNNFQSDRVSAFCLGTAV